MDELPQEPKSMAEACSSSLIQGPPPSVPARARNGGYDVQLLSSPHPSFQVECSICLKVLRKPCVISCTCGKKTCSECIEPIKTSGRPCPYCNVSDFTFIRDFGLERFLNEFEILCEYHGDGCMWSGKLGDFDDHINEDPPSADALLDGCRFVPLKCGDCENYYARHQMKEHQENFCKKRKFTCKYCTTYTSTFDEVTSNHYSDCGSFPVTCTMACGKEMRRQELQDHLNNECPLAVEKCPYAFAGCLVELPRKDLRKHNEETALHLMLLASFTQKLVSENKQLKAIVSNSNSKHEKRVGMLSINLSNITQNYTSLRAEMDRKNRLPICLWVKYNGDEVTFPYFFSHDQGYKMFVRVYPRGNGLGLFTHLSLYAGLIRGPNDRKLTWPFEGRVTIQVLNQIDSTKHHSVSIVFNSTISDKFCQISKDAREGKELGYDRLISHVELRRNFVKNEYVAIKVLCVDRGTYIF